MKIQLIYLLLVVLLLKVCIAAKSGLYEQENEDNEDNEENEYNEDNGEVLEESYENEYENAPRKSSFSVSEEKININPEEKVISKTEKPSTQIKKRHDYKLSFKKPYYYYNDTNIIPNWKYFGDAIPSENMIRLAPSIPNKKGSIWSEIPNQYDEWEVELKLQISGRGMKGSQGIALFYSQKKLENDQFYGSENVWKGLAIVFDSLNVEETSHIPIINVLYNDGNTLIKTKKDYNSISKGLCVGDFRNSPGPIYAKIHYANKKLSLKVDLSHHGNEFYECATIENIDIPKNYYFGLSAKSGNSNADDHDVVSFDFYELNPKITEKAKRPLEEEIIEEEGEFVMDEDTIKHIKEIEKEIEDEDVEEIDDDPEIPHSINANTVYEFQYKILDIVNRIYSYLKNAPIPNMDAVNSNTNNDNTEYFDKFSSQLDDLKKELVNVNLLLVNVKDTVEANTQRIENKIFGAKEEIKLIKQNGISNNRAVQEEIRKLHSENMDIINNQKESGNTNIWMVVFISFLLNTLGVYIVVRVLPKSRDDGYNINKIHNF